MSVQTVLDLAQRAGVMIATAESCTAGMIAARLTDMPGSSAVFERGVVTYSNAAKMDMLGVRAKTLADHGAVSPEVAAEMASGALTSSRGHAKLSVAVTGIAGPGGSEHKPEGRVCFATALMVGPAPRLHVETVDFGAIGRAQVRQATVDHALKLLIRALS